MAAALGDAQASTGDIRGKRNTATFTQAALRNLNRMKANGVH
jgi:hypothetical protein